MGLKGSLRDFGISEILQLIGLQSRSGKLTVTANQMEYGIQISNGKVVRVEKSPESETESLESYLMRSKAATPEQIRNVAQRAKSDLKPIEAVLVDQSVVSGADLKVFLAMRNLDLINRLFLIKDGEYEFEAGPVSYHPNHVAELNTEQVLMDGYRIKDELPGILKEIGSEGAIFLKRTGEFRVEEKLDPLEDKVYRLVDGERTPTSISALARLNQFDTLKVLAELKRKGRIELKVAKQEAKGREIRPNGHPSGLLGADRHLRVTVPARRSDLPVPFQVPDQPDL